MVKKKVWTFLLEDVEGAEASLKAQRDTLMRYETPSGERFLGVLLSVRPRPLRDDEIQEYRGHDSPVPRRLLEVKVEELVGRQGRGRRAS
jgi:hypothetical protein